MVAQTSFNHSKATQALNFLARKQGGKISKVKALKLVYFADRYHLRKYGRLITNDTYYAMKLGPVASKVYDIADFDSYQSDKELEYVSKYIARIKNDHELQSIADVDLDVFSNSDIEALEFVWDKFGNLDKWGVSDITHKYPEWKKHKQELQHCLRVPMDIEDFFEDPEDDKLEKCHELDETSKGISIDCLREEELIEALWS